MIEPQRFEAERRQAEKVAFAGFIVLVIIVLYANVASSNEEPDTALWLARSCVGESNFDSLESGECAAIMHVYLKRTMVSNMSMYEIVRKYSAATKPRPNHPRKWVLKMDRTLEEPEHWPKTKKWETVRLLWMEILWMCDEFLLGKVPNPLPLADHYGGKFETERAINAGWKRVKAPQFRNAFWRIK